MMISKINVKSLKEDVYIYIYTVKYSRLKSSSGAPKSHIIHINLKGMKPVVEVRIFPKWSKYPKKLGHGNSSRIIGIDTVLSSQGDPPINNESLFHVPRHMVGPLPPESKTRRPHGEMGVIHPIH